MLIADILSFLDSAPAPVAKAETLEVIKIREATVRAYENIVNTFKI